MDSFKFWLQVAYRARLKRYLKGSGDMVTIYIFPSAKGEETTIFLSHFHANWEEPKMSRIPYKPSPVHASKTSENYGYD